MTSTPAITASPADEIILAILDGLPEPSRAAVAAFSALGQRARGIADDASLSVERRLALIDALDAVLEDRKPAIPLALSIGAAARDFLNAAQAVGGDSRHARHMLQAMRQDCTKARYRDWPEWLAYCRYAAAPLGRFLLDISGEDRAALPAVEGLCCAAQLLGQLQSCGDNYRDLDRVYLPERWLRDHGAAVEDLAAETASPALRAVFDEALGAAGRLLASAAPLPKLVDDRNLRVRAATAVMLARRWAHRLRRQDPLRGPVRLSAYDRGLAGLYGAWRRIA